MAELFGEHTINEELTPAVPAMSAAVDTRRVVDRIDVCRTCGKVNKHIDRHCTNVHLPWRVVYKTACFRCGKQEATTGALRKGHQGHGGFHARDELDGDHQKLWVTWAAAFLRMLVRELGLPSLSSLKQLVEEEGYLPHVEPADVPLTQELQLHLCVELGECYPAEGCHFRPPNTILALMNWETICALLGRLPLHVRNRIAKFHPEKGTPMNGIAMATAVSARPPVQSQPVSTSLAKAATAAPLTRPPIQPAPTSLAKAATAAPANSKMDDIMETDAMTVIDSHAHLDVLLGRRRCDTLNQFGSTQDLNQGGTLVLEGVVANFVYPDHWAPIHN